MDDALKLIQRSQNLVASVMDAGCIKYLHLQIERNWQNAEFLHFKIHPNSCFIFPIKDIVAKSEIQWKPTRNQKLENHTWILKVFKNISCHKFKALRSHVSPGLHVYMCLIFCCRVTQFNAHPGRPEVATAFALTDT